MANHFYGKEAFDPLYIVAQIVATQSLYFMSLGFIYWVMDALMGVPLSMDQLFTSDSYSNMSTRIAWASVFTVFLNVPASILALMWIVERAKKCLDFCTTTFALHLVGCLLYRGPPQHWEWWGCHIFAVVATVLVGEYCCALKEIREIPLTHSKGGR
mmetsp:Transcript_16140/g.40711  ORF Transcript_16140/g.40711 Transcript_16140/m.40711 type:complete len:157 (+) Transcript_16140:35-505(+)